MTPRGTRDTMAMAGKHAMPACPLKTAAPFRKIGLPPARAGHPSFLEPLP